MVADKENFVPQIKQNRPFEMAKRKEKKKKACLLLC